jgi:hypothetical protein
MGTKEGYGRLHSQIGITPDTVERDKELLFMTGNGKTFNGMNRVKHHLDDNEDDNFASFRFIQPNLEIWHTKWTNLGRICRGAWGKGLEHTNPSSLGYLAKVIKSPAPNNFLKVDFYTNFNLVHTTVRAHILSCWE